MTHKNAEILKAIADGLPLDKLQFYEPFLYPGMEWCDVNHCGVLRKLDSLFAGDGVEFRIKPEPKPDVVSDFQNYIYSPPLGYSVRCNVSYIFDGETGEVKNIELIKR